MASAPLKCFKCCNFLAFGNPSSAAPVWQQSPSTCLAVIWKIDNHLRLHLLFTSWTSGTAVLEKQTWLSYLFIASGSGFAAPSSLVGFTLRGQTRVCTWLHFAITAVTTSRLRRCFDRVQNEAGRWDKAAALVQLYWICLVSFLLANEKASVNVLTSQSAVTPRVQAMYVFPTRCDPTHTLDLKRY